MSSHRHAHVLSDLHLLHPDEPFYQSVLRFIREVPQPGDHLVLAGDIFDVYVGNKRVFRELHRPFFAAVREATARGVAVHHVEGNHDFGLAGSYLDTDCAGTNVQGDFVEIEMEGRRLRIEHGDLAASYDRTYLLLRRFFRSRLGAFLVRIAPEFLLDRLGHLWSDTSRNIKKSPEEWPEEDRERMRRAFFDYARRQLERSGADVLVMGHCHDPHGIERYMNVGFPRRHRQWIRWNPRANLLERVSYDFA